jgi:hypothetical protein
MKGLWQKCQDPHVNVVCLPNNLPVKKHYVLAVNPRLGVHYQVHKTNVYTHLLLLCLHFCTFFQGPKGTQTAPIAKNANIVAVLLCHIPALLYL